MNDIGFAASAAIDARWPSPSLQEAATLRSLLSQLLMRVKRSLSVFNPFACVNGEIDRIRSMGFETP